jgi:N-carbamoyl-L-amino-acid hydrolase
MPKVDGARLLADLDAMRRFGQVGTGVDRTALSEPDVAARRWLCRRMEQAGLTPAMDRHGTVLGRASGSRAVLIGSHTDSVPRGGWLDGALGVACGLEVARALGGGVDVVSFQDEEGTFLPCLGSRAFIGDVTPEEIQAARSRDGTSLTTALAAAGLDGTPLLAEPARYLAFLELHIEQGPVLEARGGGVGVVTGIVGIHRWRIRASGRADHAGTTPIPMRSDAGVALVRFAADVAAQLVGAGGGVETVWNIGWMTFRPGAANVVPAEAELGLEFRDADPAVLARIDAWLRGRLAEDAALSGEETTRIAPTPMEPHLAGVLEAAAAGQGVPALRMPSGAGHDAMFLARVMPAAMLFVPSIGGRSHDPAEDTAEADIVQGCQVLCDAADALLQA